MSRRKQRVQVRGACRAGKKYIPDWQQPGYESDYEKPEGDYVDVWIAMAESRAAKEPCKKPNVVDASIARAIAKAKETP